MKFKRILMLFWVVSLALTACEEGKRKEQEERQRLEQREAEREAELRKEEEQRNWEANSLAARAMEEQSLSTFMTAMQNADLAKTFTEEEGPFTIFAPTDEAFENLEKAEMDTLFDNDNEGELTSVLEYHMVQDEISYEELSERIKDGDGEYTITTMSGAELTALMSGEDIILKDGNGNTASLTQSSGIAASNGVLHLIDEVLREEND